MELTRDNLKAQLPVIVESTFGNDFDESNLESFVTTVLDSYDIRDQKPFNVTVVALAAWQRIVPLHKSVMLEDALREVFPDIADNWELEPGDSSLKNKTYSQAENR